LVLGGVLLLILAAAGCAKQEPSVVAYVDDTKITQQQLDDAVEGVSSILEEGQSVSRPAVVNAMIHGAIAENLAAANKITITDGDRDTLIKNSNLAGLLNVPKGRSIAYDVADQQIVSDKMGSEAYIAALAKQQVTLNPASACWIRIKRRSSLISRRRLPHRCPVRRPSAACRYANSSD